MTQRNLGELEVIRQARAMAGRSRALIAGIGDDAAVLRPPRGRDLVVTTDFSLDSVHFRADLHTPESAGHRCLARGLSDLAAMGAAPLAAFLSIAVPAPLTRSRPGKPAWVLRFLAGLNALAQQHGVPLAGGDTAQAPGEQALADIVLLGTVPRGRALLRSGARPGDLLYVTGALGGAGAELQAFLSRPRAFAPLTRPGDAGAHPHLFPAPRLAAGAALLARRLATAAIDISDGLSTDAHHLAEESNVAIEIDAPAIPCHALATAAEASGQAASALALALHAGEDYELLFTASPRTRMPRRVAGLPVHAIGRVLARTGRKAAVTLVGADGARRALEAAGWQHFHSPR